MFHQPVMLEQVADLLVHEPNGFYIDGTLGGGGHTEAILQRLHQHGKVLALDRDSDSIAYAMKRLQAYEDRLIIKQRNFAELKDILKELHVKKIDGLLLDLGISSWQIDAAARGFSFDRDGQLDMRMDRRLGLTARELINTYSEDELSAMMREYGEEKKAKKIAAEIVKQRAHAIINTTFELKEAITRVVPFQQQIKSVARVFQAIRIYVNEELQNLEKVLNDSLEVTLPGGRIAVIAYHSLEDRHVKRFFNYQASTCICPPEIPVCVCGKKDKLRIITKRPLRPAAEEIASNPRSRSARLRIAQINE
jgi:16S rRNA (cytosine1402-N4)-methyltransferase